jgi:transcriptional regulator with XRE-family HTH domain
MMGGGEAAMITGAQIRAGRKLLGWSPLDLAKRAGIGAATIIRAEASEGEAPITIVHENAIRRALVAAGTEFIADDDGTPSVRLRKDADPA